MEERKYTKDELKELAVKVAETIVERFCDVEVFSDTIENIVEEEFEKMK